MNSIILWGAVCTAFFIIFGGECTSEAAELCSSCLVLGGKNNNKPFCLPAYNMFIIYVPCSSAVIPMNHSKERKGPQNLLPLADSSQARNPPTRAT